MTRPVHAEPAKRLPDDRVTGQLIVRFKPGAVLHLASTPVARSASSKKLAASIPEAVAGPLETLRKEVGMQAVRPLFVSTEKTPPPKHGTMTLAAVRSALAISATQTPRESLRGFQIVDLKSKKLTPALLKKLRASDAIELVEPVPNRWLSAKKKAANADPFVNRQWGLRAIRWFNGARPDAADVHVAVLDSGIDTNHADLKAMIEDYRRGSNKERDFLGHGTHVSGIIAAQVNNGVGIAGIANCRLHCWKVFDDPKGEQQGGGIQFRVLQPGTRECARLGCQGRKSQSRRGGILSGRGDRVQGVERRRRGCGRSHGQRV